MVAVIGGGAAGLMAAATIVEERTGVHVTLFERNPRLGAKVLISGGGRCNVTTGVTDVAQALTRYPRGARWLRHAMHAFPPAAVVAWFEAHGVPLKTEPDLRVFPVSDRGRDVVDVFERIFAAAGADVRLRLRVTGLRRLGGGYLVEADSGSETAGPFSAVILTTGGQAFRHTGSTGDGYAIARSLGHHVTPLSPSLNAWVVAEPWAKGLAGLTFPDAQLSVAPADGATGGRRPFSLRGPFLFTHFGVTGPAVFALGSLAAALPFDTARPLALRINLMPNLTADQIDRLLRERFAALGGREVANVLDTLLPRSICPVLCELAGINPAVRAARLDRAGRRRLAALIGALPLSVVGRRGGEEFVTAGGVATDEVDPRTMASRLAPGLYLAGEILDVDGFTGGFNLQAAWATGRLAGLAAGAALEGGRGP